MNRKHFDDKRKTNTKKTVIWIIIALILIAATAVFGFFAVKASTDKIYDGVYVGSVNLSGLTEDEALLEIANEYTSDDTTFRFRCEGVNFEIYSSQIELDLDFEATAEKAAEYGKDGNVFQRIIKMIKLSKNPEKINLVLDCNTDVLKYQINEKMSDKVADVQPYTVNLGENCLKITNGTPGIGVDIEKVLSLMAESLTFGKFDEIIEITLESIEPEKINPEKFYEEYNREPKDAECVEENGTLNIIPEIVGIKLDKNRTISILKENLDNENEFEIPAVITYPEITAAKLEEEYTDTLIGTYSTDYSSSSANRKENIRLASTKIHNLILNPGEVFSFNEIVGPRTEAAGYKIAHVYSGNKVVDGLGGGICQVSSTLYNAVVFADLEIVYRTNHSIPVSYVPLGRDATVSYGTIDFKFKNNKQTPVKFEVIADGSRLTVNVYGRKKYKKDITIETKILESVPFSTTEIKDDTMFEDERKVEEAGANGTRVEAYKIVRENGAVVSNTLLCKSNYSPTSEVVRVGTKKREELIPPAMEDEPVSPETLAPDITQNQSGPTDDAESSAAVVPDALELPADVGDDDFQ